MSEREREMAKEKKRKENLKGMRNKMKKRILVITLLFLLVVGAYFPRHTTGKHQPCKEGVGFFSVKWKCIYTGRGWWHFFLFSKSQEFFFSRFFNKIFIINPWVVLLGVRKKKEIFCCGGWWIYNEKCGER